MLGIFILSLCPLQGLRSHPLGPEVELSSFSGNSSLAVTSSPRDSKLSPALTPLPEQLEPEDSDPSQHALQQWSEAPQSVHRQPKRVREYELSAMDHQDSTQHLSSSMPEAPSHSQGHAPSPVTNQQQQTHPLAEHASFHTPDNTPNSAASDLQPSMGHQLRSHEAILDDMFPSIRKITPIGSEDEDEPANASQASLHSATQTHQVIDSLSPAISIALLSIATAFKCYMRQQLTQQLDVAQNRACCFKPWVS